MNPVALERATARKPVQDRSRERFGQVLDAADAVLREGGLAAFSIPTLADRLGYTRASIYKFFPTPNAVLNELMQRYLTGLEQALAARAQEVLQLDWREGMRLIAFSAADFYNAHPVARLLVLGGPVSDEGYRAQELTIQRLGSLARTLLRTRGIALPEAKPDAATLLVEIGTTCFRLSQFLHGKITPQYREEAVYAMEAYLSKYSGGTRS